MQNFILSIQHPSAKFILLVKAPDIRENLHSLLLKSSQNTSLFCLQGGEPNHIFGTDTSSAICVMVMAPLRSEMFGETFSGLKTGMVSDKSCVGLDI